MDATTHPGSENAAFDLKNEATLKEAYKELYSDLFYYALKISGKKQLSQDAIQEIFIKLWQDRFSLHVRTSLKAYLLKSLRRKLIRLMQKEARYFSSELSEAQLDPDLSLNQEELIILGEDKERQKEALQEALGLLTRRQREAIFLRYYQELSIPEIAQVMEVNYQSVVNYIHRAFLILREEKMLKNLS